ncbi:uncharacterized protein YbbC (DUF1343 family) [Hydrogenoanaerobacterium saccharovorans]|uniref:Uncharacterized conserved protein YbbC, DUF1343 family n=1 Tax=Hydrogenoanaerobacterium saccharovorans TaxID=474960 RepID=A0A1H8EC17_9FIRM|nr:DUF1343 domain-containing protein [Hydrogenoanaerobacterium saccharovorans]RPF42036.1 uncharacterized protein YbbC (DUF1343 family) [Hydrogenoanaerobacterium saccharovorans]SEN17015.1 Uncharacterized conserved protein YbbC, DUF1343 family [Hydrogenoanaerobacterium saccharovorans]
MVCNGIDRIDSFPHLFKKKALGLITSVSGVNLALQSTIEILHKSYGLTALFAPEHGVRGDRDAGETVDTYTDAETGLLVYSLYRKDSKRLTEEMLARVDAVVYDIQDVGVRYYTFISTLLLAMEDCAKCGKELIVLDRLNPLGDRVEGNLLKTEYTSFVGAYPLCMRYGLTAGEFATMANSEKKMGCKLTVVPCASWQRQMLFPQTGNLWMMPSLGMPRFDTALLYPGTCLFEGTNVSEGRGTACPFEIIGAPYISAPALSREMNAKALPGLLFTPVYFKPTASKHADKACQGVHLHITDYAAVEPVRTGVELLSKIAQMYPKDFQILPPSKEGGRPFISLLTGDSLFEQPGWDEKQILADFETECKAFAEYKKQFHLYD